MSKKVFDISEVKPGDEFVYHGEVFTYDVGKGMPTPAKLYRVIAVGEEMVFMGVDGGKETLVHRDQIKNGIYVRYKKPKIERVTRFLVKDKDYGIRWYVDYPDRSMIGGIQVTLIDDKITKVEIIDV